MPHPDAKQVVHSYLRALRERDADALPQLIAADAVYRILGSHPLAGTWVGLDEILNKFMIPMGELFDPHAPYAIETTRVFAEGDQVAVECVTRSTTMTGRPYAIDICALFTVADGKITSMREFFDTQYFARTLFGNDDPSGQKENRMIGDKVRAIWAQQLNLDVFSDHDDFFRLGGNSLILVRTQQAVEEALGVEVPLDELLNRPTVASLSAYLALLAI